jgi:hypothetical protein
VPAAGQGFQTDGVQIDILESSETQVLRARLTRLGERKKESDA